MIFSFRVRISKGRYSLESITCKMLSLINRWARDGHVMGTCLPLTYSRGSPTLLTSVPFFLNLGMDFHGTPKNYNIIFMHNGFFKSKQKLNALGWYEDMTVQYHKVKRLYDLDSNY